MVMTIKPKKVKTDIHRSRQVTAHLGPGLLRGLSLLTGGRWAHGEESMPTINPRCKHSKPHRAIKESYMAYWAPACNPSSWIRPWSTTLVQSNTKCTKTFRQNNLTTARKEQKTTITQNHQLETKGRFLPVGLIFSHRSRKSLLSVNNNPGNE